MSGHVGRVALVALGISGASRSVLAQATVTARVRTTAGDSTDAARRRAHEDTVAFREDSAQAVQDSLMARRLRARVVPLTPELLGTAFRDAHARELLTRARAARLAQDSSLTGYDATTYERFSVEFGGRQSGRERLLLRTERATRVRWARGVGAVIDVTGVRSASPALGGEADVDAGEPAVPYFPGREALWVGSGLAQANVGDGMIVNPLARGAEAYYTYASGDSLVLQLPGRRPVVVRELRVRPRAPGWRVVVGSLWFEATGGQLVRAVYRLAEPIDMISVGLSFGEGTGGVATGIARALMPTVTAQISVVTIDYGLFEGRFWLPRVQTMEGGATIGALRLPVQVQQRFEYADVNGALNLPPVRVTPLDTASGLAAYVARDTARLHDCRDPSASSVRTAVRYNKTLPVVVNTPCDSAALARSATLPPSVYTPTDTLFGGDERAALVEDALGLGRQAGWAPQAPTVRYGLGYTRYNRVEGLSTALDARQVYGAGYTGHALLRMGVADRVPEGELALSRSNGRETVTLGAYRRFAVANDWGDPLGFGASLTALLFGRDDGVYYRTGGAEVTHEQVGGLFDQWRIFAERQAGAVARTQFSLSSAFGGHELDDRLDVGATNGNVLGVALRRRGSIGDDPSRFRALSDLRLEGATGTFDYVRGMIDVTLAQPLSPRFGGVLTVSGGTSGGDLPVQRLWYLGGPYTVRGQPVASAVGNAYWFTRAEFGGTGLVARPLVFADIGWAGDRTRWITGVNPISGAGVGMSIMDGLLRLDVARGIRPARGARVDAYFDTRL